MRTLSTIHRSDASLPHWQTLKLLLSASIVLNVYLSLTAEPQLSFSLLIEMFNLILIQMFVFIAGYTTQTITWQTWRSRLLPALIIYVTFQTIDMIPLYAHDQFTWQRYLLSPQNGVWFFLAVPFWQAICLLLSPILQQWRTALLFLVVTVIAAFFVRHTDSIESGFAVVILYFPFFVIAYFFDDQRIVWLRQRPLLVQLAMLFSVIALLSLQPSITSIVQETLHAPLLVAIVSDLLLFCASLLLGVIVIFLAPSSDRFQAIANNALGIYLIHPILCFMILTVLRPLLPELHWFWLIGLALLTIALSLLLATNATIHWFLNPVLQRKKGE